MKERPILFSGPMVRAIFAGGKTQTRRVVKWKGLAQGLNLQFTGLTVAQRREGWVLESKSATCWEERSAPTRCPYGEVGDRLWVRETWRPTGRTLEESRAITEDVMSGTAVDYRATALDELAKAGVPREEALELDEFEAWRPSIHMPRWASRLVLEITGVRIERLQAISEADAVAEGASTPGPFARHHFRDLWARINGAESWAANPWVWVVEFKRLDRAHG